MDLIENRDADFTRWVVDTGLLHTCFVVVDVGVQGGESAKWHSLGDHLVVHGFDAIEETIQELNRQFAGSRNYHYHWIAAGDRDGTQDFFYNAADPYSSSFFAPGRSRYDRLPDNALRRVPMRRLDGLLADGVITAPDFVKVDVEGFELSVLTGARETLSSALGFEVESNFGISELYPRTHFGAMIDIALSNNLFVHDLVFNRVPAASFQRALARKGLPPVRDEESIGKPATLNVLFSRDIVFEADHPATFSRPVGPRDTDMLIKQMILLELCGLGDCAIDIADRFAEQLGARMDVEKAQILLADPDCRYPAGRAEALAVRTRDAAYVAENVALRARISELLEVEANQKRAVQTLSDLLNARPVVSPTSLGLTQRLGVLLRKLRPNAR